MLTAHLETGHLAAAAAAAAVCSRQHVSMAAAPFLRLPVLGPSFRMLPSACSAARGRHHSAGRASPVCQAAPQPPQSAQENRGKSERSAVRRRRRPQPPPPPLLDSNYDSVPTAGQEPDELGSDRSDRTVEASTSEEGGREPGSSPPAPAPASDALRAEATRPYPADPIPHDLPEGPAMEAQPEGEGAGGIRSPWDRAAAAAAVEVDAEIVSLPDVPQTSAREEPAAMIQEAQFTDVPTDPAEAARQQAARQRAAEEAYARQQAKDHLNRKAEILLEILNAGTALEAKIRQHRDEIDEFMLQMLYKRIEASQKLDEPEELVKSMALLWQRLRSEATRMAASPAERLADEALEILGSRKQRDYTSRKQEVAERLMAAFTAPGSRPINIFGMAEVLAAGGTVESEEAVREHVPRGSFLEEAQQLLDGALARSEELRTVLDSRNLDPEDSEAVTVELQFRAEAVNYLQDVLDIARALPDV